MENQTEYKDTSVELAKIWTMFSSGGIFAGFHAIDDIAKVKIDIGSIKPDKSLDGSTEIYIDPFELLAVLDAIYFGKIHEIWGPKGYSLYGGSAQNKVSRAFKVEWMEEKKRWRFATAHFPGVVTGTGAITPEPGSKPLSSHSIQMRLPDIAKLRVRLQAHLSASYDVIVENMK